MMNKNFEKSNHLVLNFYKDGYSIAIKLNEFPVFTSETILETAKISYEETSLLDYIENEELPPLLVEMIDSSPKLNKYKIWYNGCLVLEVRDKTNNRESYFILLKPNNLSMLNDVSRLTGSNSWTTREKLYLESQIVLYNSPPLLLEPDDIDVEPPELWKPRKLPYTKCKTSTSDNLVPENLPPELGLQEFLATNRVKRSLSAREQRLFFSRR